MLIDNQIEKVFSPISIEAIAQASMRLAQITGFTPLVKNENYSERFHSNIWFKREDLQVVRSYKIRGAYNKIAQLSSEELQKGIVCASAGNHAQGVAYTCKKMGVKGKIFMPVTTPKQKQTQTKHFGKEYVEIILVGDTFDDCFVESIRYAQSHNITFVHPFDDKDVIAGQGTVAHEIFQQMSTVPDYIIVPVGGGGLVSGILSYVKVLFPSVKIIGVEPAGAPALFHSLRAGQNIALDTIDKFVDGAAVKKIGELNFSICQSSIDRVITVAEGKVCSSILQLYNEEAIIAEPAGALAISALDELHDEIKNKNVVCIVSGSNNDITRTEEIRERALLHDGLKHYFKISFAQRAGALKEFVSEVLGPDDDIAFFQYTKKNNREKGPAIVGIEIRDKSDFQLLMNKLTAKKIQYEYLNNDPERLALLV